MTKLTGSIDEVKYSLVLTEEQLKHLWWLVEADRAMQSAYPPCDDPLILDETILEQMKHPDFNPLD